MIPGFIEFSDKDLKDPKVFLEKLNTYLRKVQLTGSRTIRPISSIPTSDEIQEGEDFYYEDGSTKRRYFKIQNVVHYIVVDS